MKLLVTDPLCKRLLPLLPPPPQHRFLYPGPKLLDYHTVRTRILFVLQTGIAWDDLPAELGCGCGKTYRDNLTKAARGSSCMRRCCWPNSAGST